MDPDAPIRQGETLTQVKPAPPQAPEAGLRIGLEPGPVLSHADGMTDGQTQSESVADLVPAWDAEGRVRPMDRLEVHRRGLRHVAVSVFLTDGERTLIRRRAAGRCPSGGKWSNACCTHPRWSEHYAVCAARGLREELGIVGLALKKRGRVEYRADLGDGMIEHEVVQIFLAEVDAGALRLAPDPAEIAETRWIAPCDLRAGIAADPGAFTPRLRICLEEHGDRLLGPETAERSAS